MDQENNIIQTTENNSNLKTKLPVHHQFNNWFKSSIFLKTKKHPFIFLSIFFLFVISIIGAVKFATPKVSPVNVAENLTILAASPYGTISGRENAVEIEFNYPVNPHHALEFIEISPMVGGELVQGATQNILQYKFSSPLPSGVEYTVLIKKGLPALGGKKLTADY